MTSDETTTSAQPNLPHQFWRYKYLIAGVAVLAGVIALVVSLLQPTQYESHGSVFLNDPRNSADLTSELGIAPDLARHLTIEANLMQSLPVAERAAEILNDGTTAEEIDAAVQAQANTDIGAVAISASMPTADRAVATQDAVVQAYEQIVTRQIQQAADDTVSVLNESLVETEARIANLDALLADDPTDSVLEARRNAAMAQLVTVDNRIEQLTVGTEVYGSGVRLYVADAPPTSPTQPQPLRNTAIALALGALAATIWVWWSTSDQ